MYFNKNRLKNQLVAVQRSSGINWCLKNECPLIFVNKKNVMHSPPDIYLKNEIYTECLITEEIKNNPIIKKFSEIVQGYAKNSFELNTKNLAKLLSQKAIELNLVKNSKDHGKFISDFLIEETPSCWRIEHFPDLKKTTMGQFLNEFYYALLTKKPVKKLNILLIISALFPSDVNALLVVLNMTRYTKKLQKLFSRRKKSLLRILIILDKQKKLLKK